MRAAGVPGVDVRRAVDRCTTSFDGVHSSHSFSFGRHYDPANTGHGALLANNEDVIAAGSGFDTHPHRDLEIVTWVLSGSLVHRDSTGHRGVAHPGMVQRLSAGRGVLHSERNDAPDPGGEPPREPLRLVQMWVLPNESGGDPAYEQRDVVDHLRAGDLLVVASGMPRHGGAAALRLRNRDAALHAARLAPGRSVQLPDAPHVHLFVTRGGVALEGAGALTAGDAARLTGGGGHRLTARGAAEVLVWELHAGSGG
jgi:redox-sensitive bicupin YhaK (pirin superfamily)